jgi:hypothetical protein
MQCPFVCFAGPLFPFVIIAIALVSVILEGKRQKERLKRLCLHLQGRVSGFLTPSFKGQHEGLWYTLTLGAEGKNAPPQLVVSFEKPCSFSLSIYKETVFSRLGEQFGIVRELKVNDPSFDKEFLIFSRKPQQALLFLNGPSAKDTIRSFFAEGFHAFLVSGKTVVLKRRLSETINAPSADQIKAVVQRLASLCRGLYA